MVGKKKFGLKSGRLLGEGTNSDEEVVGIEIGLTLSRGIYGE